MSAATLTELVEELDLDVDLDDLERGELEELDLSDQGLDAIPACVFEVESLTELCLEDNSITQISSEIAKLGSLAELYIR